MSKGYVQWEINSGKSYIKMDSINKLKKAEAIIFDCDGVLIDIRDSCNKAISETVTYLISEVTGYKFKEKPVSKEVIYHFKRSGGFNSDWDLAYTISMYILCILPKDFQDAFLKHSEINRSEKDVFKRFLSIKKGIIKECNPNSLLNIMDKLEEKLKNYAKFSNASGVVNIEKEQINNKRFYEAIKELLSYPGNVGESLITTLFEEIFCGPHLFRELYKQEPRIWVKNGLIENEQIIITPQTLDKLTLIIGKANFGIASGRPFQLARYTLKGLLKRFNPKAIVFLEDVEAAEREGEGMNLKKPNPFSLFKSSEILKPYKFLLYIGDSMEDVKMVREANKMDPRFIFVGVYGYSDHKKDVLNDFFQVEAEAIIPSINDLPYILKST